MSAADLTPDGFSKRRLDRFSRTRAARSWSSETTSFGTGPSAGWFDEVCSTLYAPGSSEPVLTHVPARDVPGGCVNLHGHVHRWVPGGIRRINVVIEQVRYRPQALTVIRQLAECLVQGERVPGRTMAQQLTYSGEGGANVVTGERLRDQGAE